MARSARAGVFAFQFLMSLSLIGCATSRPPAPPIEPAPAPPPPPPVAPAPPGPAARTDCKSQAAPNLAVGGRVTSSHPGGGAELAPALAFDDNIGSEWISPAPHPWIAYELPGGRPQQVVTYTLAVGLNESASSNDPTTWELQGSNDKTTWTTVDSRTNQVFVARLEPRLYTVARPGPYRSYRLVVGANGGGPGLRLAELQLFGPGTPVFSIDDAVEGPGRHSFQYSKGWSRNRNDFLFEQRRYGHSSTWTFVRDEHATVLFDGSQIAVYAVKFTNHGIAGISIDDGPETEIDLYGQLAVDQKLYTSPTLCAGRHTLRIRVTGKKNPASAGTGVSLDRVQIVP